MVNHLWRVKTGRVTKMSCLFSNAYTIPPRKLHFTLSGDSSVVRAPDLRLKGHGFESLQEQQENFLVQAQLSVLTLISVSVPPLCYCSSM